MPTYATPRPLNNQQSAIPNVCAWPNLTLLPSGDILAVIFNQPCHGLWEGGVDAWVSRDGGVTWTFRGRVAEYDRPGTNRMDKAVGLDKHGELIAMVGGWTDRKPPGGGDAPFDRARRITPRVYRGGADGRDAWRPGSDLPAAPGDNATLAVFGDIHSASDGRLLATAYAPIRDSLLHYRSYLLASSDNGATWAVAALLNERGNETAVLLLTDDHWIAASREEHTRHLEQFASDDSGRTWRRVGPLTQTDQVTSHLTRLRDGRVLLSYGDRRSDRFGVEGRLSADAGRTWSEPFRLADCPMWDCGYPSSVQRDDGQVVTAYYTHLPGEFKYEMRVVTWDPDLIS